MHLRAQILCLYVFFNTCGMTHWEVYLMRQILAAFTVYHGLSVNGPFYSLIRNIDSLIQCSYLEGRAHFIITILFLGSQSPLKPPPVRQMVRYKIIFSIFVFLMTRSQSVIVQWLVSPPVTRETGVRFPVTEFLGELAQLAARVLSMHKVAGSIPAFSNFFTSQRRNPPDIIEYFTTCTTTL